MATEKKIIESEMKKISDMQRINAIVGECTIHRRGKINNDSKLCETK